VDPRAGPYFVVKWKIPFAAVNRTLATHTVVRHFTDRHSGPKAFQAQKVQIMSNEYVNVCKISPAFFLASALSQITRSPNKGIAGNVQSLYTRPKKPPTSHVLGHSKDLRSNIEGSSKRERIPRPEFNRIAILMQFSPWPSPTSIATAFSFVEGWNGTMNKHYINFLPQKVLTDSMQQPIMRRPRLEFPSFFSVFTRVLMGPTPNQTRIHTLFLSDPFHITLSPLSTSRKPSPLLKFSY